MATTQYHSLSLANYKKHMKAVHHQSEANIGPSKVQPSVQTMFLKAKAKENHSRALDGLEIDLTNEKKSAETCVDETGN